MEKRDVHRRLRTMILDMDIGPGERLTERWAETRVGASRTPVRGALLRLEAEGLVCREGRGWMVAPIDLDEIEQLFVYRETLEVAAMRLTVARGVPDAVAGLEALLDACGADASTDQVHRTGMEFHVALAKLSGNEFMCRGIADAMTRLSRARWLESDAKHAGWAEHRAVLAALRAGRGEAAVGLVETHVRGTRDRLLGVLREGRRSLRARGIVVA